MGEGLVGGGVEREVRVPWKRMGPSVKVSLGWGEME